MPPSLMEERELRVSTLEAFFDLVFVFAITQLTSLIEHDLSLQESPAPDWSSWSCPGCTADTRG